MPTRRRLPFRYRTPSLPPRTCEKKDAQAPRPFCREIDFLPPLCAELDGGRGDSLQEEAAAAVAATRRSSFVMRAGRPLDAAAACLPGLRRSR
ncbi:hypothetical protein GWI33_006287 [Rhynchophorus ferrugineus]|uniref:Uncharacterized protein n=1 Tax=Rhynchophorus ferrugineus TaxID=354439 RepID=A0A834IUV4_RHYFE|nr:hypothetical protein GWI33_006287 [Rhynchophorus ferrugineus]